METLCSLQSIAEELGATEMRAVATEVFRRAKNGEQYLKRVQARTAVEVSLVAQEEEARLVATTRHGSSWMLDVEHVVADLDDPGEDYADLQIQGVSYDDVATCSTNVCGLYC